MIVYITIKSLLEQLPQEIFIRVHKSFIVNINNIEGIEGNMIKIGDQRITIGQNFRELVFQQVFKDRIIKR